MCLHLTITSELPLLSSVQKNVSLLGVCAVVLGCLSGGCEELKSMSQAWEEKDVVSGSHDMNIIYF